MDWYSEYNRLYEILKKRKAELEMAKQAYEVANEIMTIDGNMQDMAVVCEAIK